jgi:ribosomal protein S18 acetylase RimI-like enzyme
VELNTTQYTVTTSNSCTRLPVNGRTMAESDLVEACNVFRMAFGTYFGAQTPGDFWLDREYIVNRWHGDPDSAVVAESNGRVVASNIAVNWDSFGYFGPLTVSPYLWNRGVAQSLLLSAIDLFERWRLQNAALFTFASSTKHMALYQNFGYWPRFLKALMSNRQVASTTTGWVFGHGTDRRPSRFKRFIANVL